MAPDEFLKLFEFSKERIRVNFWLLHWHLRKIVVVFGITKMFRRNETFNDYLLHLLIFGTFLSRLTTYLTLHRAFGKAYTLFYSK